jgi:RNA polymerase sigma-70 factor (ECF subfamily)
LFAARVGPRLHRALVAAYGADRGQDATAEALGYAWEHWSRVKRMNNPIGYLYRVGQSKTRSRRRAYALDWPAVSATEPHVEPGLAPALALLSDVQRASVVLVHGYGWTLREVADLLGVTPSTVQTHVERAMAKLRGRLEVLDGA